MELIIGDYNYSTWSMRPWLFVHKHSLPVEIQRYGLSSSTMEQVLTKRFSAGKVPVLLDDGKDIWDSLAILEYLGERFPGTNPWPQAIGERAIARSVCAEMHSSFSALRSEAPMNIKRRFPGYRLSEAALKDLNRIQAVWRYCRKNFGHAGPWLFGAFSIADAMYAPVAMRFRSVAVELDDVSQQYCQTMHSDWSVKEWVRRALQENHRVEEDELDWPSEPNTEL